MVFVNHCHPDTPHVCATRQREFASACAAAGHRIVLLTESLPQTPSDPSPAAISAALDRHDWRRPFRLACAPIAGRMVADLREGRLTAPLRKSLIAACYLARGGLFTDWLDGTRPYWLALARSFRPEAVWASFGNTDAWAIGQGIARLADCPWIMDVKDPWSVFIPSPLRKILAFRFADYSGVTALSAAHAADLARWFDCKPTVVYSGVDDSFLTSPPPIPRNGRRLLIIGGLYADRHLAALIEGIGRWSRGGEVVSYVGNENERFLDASRPLAGRVQRESPGFVDLARMRSLAADANALLYVRNPDALYQHKLIELLSMDRPVLCLPGESAESRTIADELGTRLISCDDSASLAAALDQAIAAPTTTADRARLARYTWAAQARRLLAVLEGSR
jgi:hypothetical protein